MHRRRLVRRQLWNQALEIAPVGSRCVLDAGTGEAYFTQFLAEQRPCRLVSVSCDRREFDVARNRLGSLAHAIEFMEADLTSMPHVASQQFDVVGADFLIAAVSASRPFREIELLKELCRVLRPQGQLIIVGWEADKPRDAKIDRLIRRLFAMREAAHHLAGERPFREHPAFWVENRLSEIGLAIENRIVIPDVHYDWQWFTMNVRSVAKRSPDDAIRDALVRGVNQIETELATIGTLTAGIQFGRLYAVVARKCQAKLLALPDAVQ